MRRVYLRIAAGVVVASLVGWGAVAVVVPLFIGRFEESGVRTPMISGGIRLIAASLDAVRRDEWPARLDAARRYPSTSATACQRANANGWSPHPSSLLHRLRHRSVGNEPSCQRPRSNCDGEFLLP